MVPWEQVNWEEVYPEAVEYLKALIRFETVNPPGNELPAAEYLADILAKEGLAPELFKSGENRANLVCRIPGSGQAPPVLLNGHLDVVPAEPDQWSVPPFDAVEKNGWLYGRGAVDMKNMVTMSLMCMLLVKRLQLPLKRDLIFAAVADEEAGGQYGAKFMVENHPEKVRAEYSISEIGGFSMDLDGVRFYPVQVAEKGVCWLLLRTRGDPGHGSIPDPGSAPAKAAAIAHRLASRRLPQHNTEVTSVFFKKLARHLGFPKNVITRLLLCPALSGLIIDRVLPGRATALTFAAMLHNTANPTVLRAGVKTNVVPSTAEIEVDGRLLPGFSSTDFIREVRKIAGKEVEIEVINDMPATRAPADDPIMETMGRALLRHDPEAVVLPNMTTGFTDAGHWKQLGMKCYGFSPLKLPPGTAFKSLIHGHDERIPLEGFRFGLRVLFETVAETVT